MIARHKTQGMRKRGSLGNGQRGQATAPVRMTTHTNSTMKESESVRKIGEKYSAPVPETESATRGGPMKREDAGLRLVGQR